VVVVRDGSGDDPRPDSDALSIEDYAALIEGREPIPPVAVEPGELACFIYTAGTTGPSKGCMLSHNYVACMARQIARAWNRTADDVVWTPLPLFHLNAISICVVGTLLVGGSAAIARKFSVSNFWPEVQRTNATVLSPASLRADGPSWWTGSPPGRRRSSSGRTRLVPIRFARATPAFPRARSRAGRRWRRIDR